MNESKEKPLYFMRELNNNLVDINFLKLLLSRPENQPSSYWPIDAINPQVNNPFYIFTPLYSTEIIGFFDVTTNHEWPIGSGRPNAHIELVYVKPSYAGKKLCKPFMKEVLTALLNQANQSFDISIFSTVGEGIPACLCYYRAASELGLFVFYGTKEGWRPFSEETKCKEKNNQFDMKFIINK